MVIKKKPMIDPALSLALTVHRNAGVYALLLGSGVSRSAGVPTGWEIVESLIRKLALLKGVACDPDPQTWYRKEFGREPDYSEILDEVAKSPAERMQVLRGYFEPTEEERLEGLKLPTPAHRSIASLIAKKYIRVVVTTNFDRLFETALADVGVPPVVISTGDAAQGALPLAHSPCTIIKINGDYLDPRLRNTSDELSSYDDATKRLLDQVFDEYGLIVCGWSGDWDTALRGALERCSTRRFTTYWASLGSLTQKAQDLVNLRQAAVLAILGADEFFTGLLDRVSALEDMSLSDVLSARVAVSRMKKYLADTTKQINLHDLLTSETERTHAALMGPHFAATKGLRARVNSYESALETILGLMICGVFWGSSHNDALLLRCYKRIADQEMSQRPVVPELSRYPGLFLLYGVGVAACAAHNYRFLRSILGLKVRHVAYRGEQSVAAVLDDEFVFTKYDQAQVLGGKYMCEHLFEVLREPLREYLPSDYEYERAFDWFEYLLCLCHCDAAVTRSTLADMKAQDAKFYLPASIGCFGLNNAPAPRSAIQAETELRSGEPRPEKVAAILGAGFFESGGQHDDKYREVKAAFDRFVALKRAGLIASY
jgi:hypothetical protein